MAWPEEDQEAGGKCQGTILVSWVLNSILAARLHVINKEDRINCAAAYFVTGLRSAPTEGEFSRRAA